MVQQEGMFVSQSVVRTQMAAIDALERQLRVASSNNTALQRQQAQLMESVHTLINMVATTTGTHSLMFLLAFSNFQNICSSVSRISCLQTTNTSKVLPHITFTLYDC